jgi:hypothetical protein
MVNLKLEKTLREKIVEHYQDNQYTVTRPLLDRMLQNSVTEEIVFHGKELVISFKLKCGFTIMGKAAVVNSDKFDINTCRLLAYENAISQLWMLEGYRMQWKMYSEQEK